MIRRLVVLGASGDLMERLLASALAALRSRGDLPDGFSVLGVALSDWDTAAFRDHITSALEQHAPGLDPAVRAATIDSLSYARGDVTQAPICGRRSAIPASRSPSTWRCLRRSSTDGARRHRSRAARGQPSRDREAVR